MHKMIFYVNFNGFIIKTVQLSEKKNAIRSFIDHSATTKITKFHREFPGKGIDVYIRKFKIVPIVICLLSCVIF